MTHSTKQLIELALTEDAAHNDVTAIATIDAASYGQARITAKARGVISGIAVADQVFSQLSADITCRWHCEDGTPVESGSLIAELEGPLRQLLAAERTALNFLQHLSGIATATHHFVRQLSGTNCQVVDTRKTAPGLRQLEKQAVLDGGGGNHRLDLQSGMLIKENHIAACGSITQAIQACRDSNQSCWVEVECETLDEVTEAVLAKPDIILLDNMPTDMVRQARSMVPDTIILEASGNITLHNAREYALTGINRIAIGAITHSAPALDLSMRVSSR